MRSRGIASVAPTFVAWLFRIARNTLTDHYRRRRSTVAWDLVPEILQPTAHNLEEGALQREAVDALRVLGGALDADTRELLALRFGARLTVGEIAAVLGKGEAATRKKLARTLHALADQLDDQHSFRIAFEQLLARERAVREIKVAR